MSKLKKAELANFTSKSDLATLYYKFNERDTKQGSLSKK